MKYIWLLLFTPLVIISLWYISTPESSKNVTEIIPRVTNERTPSPIPTPSIRTIQYKDQTIAYDLFTAKPSAITLVPNYTTKTSVRSLMESYSCTLAINGGFYDTRDQPLGYVVSGREHIGKPLQSALFNGFISIDMDNKALIDTAVPSDSSKIILQTGPLLISEDKTLPLAISNEKHARRMIAATTESGKLVFITTYNAEAVFDGPTLGDLPSITMSIAQKESLSIHAAINLDGGSASAFFSKTLSLDEITPVGSVFCIQE